jgi:pimeloyl-ACP methyl ester carboxylesterase
LHPLAEQWAARGSHVDGPLGHVFVVDEPPDEEPDGPPVLLLHGFPTCSFDWRHVWPQLQRRRRVVAPDLPGYGLSDKPDLTHGMEEAADAVVAVADQLDLDEVDLVTHDMGDTVGGVLLARDLDGHLPFAVRRRVVSNGSIYIDMAGLRWQQRLLLALPDRTLPVDLPSVMYTRGLERIYGESPPPPGELAALWDLFRLQHGNRKVTRLIRYIEERRRHEDRWTGAIETHPSPLAVVWGDQDPVAVPAMVQRLTDARPETEVTWLRGVGHFPMTEAPDAFAAAVLTSLG